MDKCNSLRELTLSYVGTIFVTSQWLLDLFGKFPLLEKLELDGCIMSERIKISSARLKVLNFGACIDSELKEAEIDAPNLVSCRYRELESKLPAISFLNTSIQLEFNVFFEIRLCVAFGRLRIFIQSIKPINVLAYVTLQILYPTVSIPMQVDHAIGFAFFFSLIFFSFELVVCFGYYRLSSIWVDYKIFHSLQQGLNY